MANEKSEAPKAKKYKLIQGSFTHGHSESGPNRTLEGDTCMLTDAEAKHGLAAKTLELCQ